MGRTSLIIGTALIGIVAVLGSTIFRTDSFAVLEKKIANHESFIVLIKLENCSACNLLDEKTQDGDWFTEAEPITVTISRKEKDAFKERILEILPTFKYYPSIYYFDKGVMKSEFDLSSLDNVETRFRQWMENIR